MTRDEWFARLEDHGGGDAPGPNVIDSLRSVGIVVEVLNHLPSNVVLVDGRIVGVEEGRRISAAIGRWPHMIPPT